MCSFFLYLCMTNNNPIGLFDSGIGGITIWKAINQLMPFENTIYLADSINAPYGQKSPDEITALCFKNVEFLLKQDVKIIVVACNTATTNSIVALRNNFDIPFIGIEPAIKPAATQSKTHTIGILATKGTLNSTLFSKTVHSYQNIKIIEQIGHGLVQLIENGDAQSAEMTELLQDYLQPMIAQNIDYLVLGCSHYPLLLPQIKALLPNNVIIIDSGDAVAKQTFHILETIVGLNDQKMKPKNIFHINTQSKVLKTILNTQHHVFETTF